MFIRWMERKRSETMNPYMKEKYKDELYELVDALDEMHKERHSVDIKSCPFCGGQASVRFRALPIMMATDAGCLYLVRCHECGAEGPEFVAEPWAIRAWNRRVEME